MKSVMRVGLAVAIYAGLAVWLAAPANGQMIRAEIPFAFHVREANMPAGEYTLRLDTATRQVTVESLNGLAMARFFALTSDDTVEAKACLVFHKYGNSYYLDRVKGGHSPWMWKAPDSKKERQAERIARAYANAEIAEVRVPVTAKAAR